MLAKQVPIYAPSDIKEYIVTVVSLYDKDEDGIGYEDKLKVTAPNARVATEKAFNKLLDSQCVYFDLVSVQSVGHFDEF